MPTVNESKTSNSYLFAHRVSGYQALRAFLEHVGSAAPHDDIPWLSFLDFAERGDPSPLMTLVSRPYNLHLVLMQESSPAVPETVWLLLSNVPKEHGATTERTRAALTSVVERHIGIRRASLQIVK